MPRQTSRLAIVLLAATAALPSGASAGTVLTWTEWRVKDGRETRESSEARIGKAGMRIRVTKQGDGTPYLTTTYRHDTRTLYLDQGVPVPIEVNAERLEQLAAVMKAAEGGSGQEGAPTPVPALVPLGGTEQVAGHACKTYLLRRPGLPDRSFCLAPRADLGLAAADVDMLREMIDLLQRLGSLGRRMAPPPGGQPPPPDDSLNPYGFAEGVPLRIWDTRDGKTAWESRVTGLQSAEISDAKLAAPH